MKLILIYFSFVNIFAFCQTCDTIDTKSINCIDKNGLKQGYWINQNRILISSSNLGHGSNVKDVYKYQKVSEGEYKNGLKINTWKYYSQQYENRINSEITYKTDGTVFEKNHENQFDLTISKDSSVTVGLVYYNSDTIIVQLQSKMGKFVLKNRDIYSFNCPDFETFEYELSKLIEGFYDRKIKELKL